jgi:hypothetical protein
MSVLDKFEGNVEGAFDRAAGAVFKAPIEPAQIAKAALRQMTRNKLVGAGRQFAPTLYNVLVNATDDKRLFGFYPTMATEIENYLLAKGTDAGLEFDGRPLVRFIVDEKLKSGRFDVIAENVSAPVIEQLRAEELEYYGIAPKGKGRKAGVAAGGAGVAAGGAGAAGAAAAARASDSIDLLPPLRAGNAPRQAAGGAGAQAASSLAANGAAAAFGGLAEAAGPGARALGANPALAGAAGGRGAAGGGRDSAAGPGAAGQDDRTTRASNNGPDLASEPSTGSAVLVNTATGATHALLTRHVVAGRDLGNAIHVNDSNASRRHARFEQNALGTWKVIDLGSTNGTLLNDQPATQAILRDGDLITFGTTVLEFRE